MRGLIESHEAFRRECLNLCPSEAMTSTLVREALASDISRRYWCESGDYAGGRFIQEIEEIGVGLARELFGASFVDLTPVSGHIALLAALTSCTSSGGTVLMLPEAAGGYTVDGFLARSGLTLEAFPFDETAFAISPEAAAETVRRVRPQVAVLGSSVCPLPYPVAAVARACREAGSRLIYDAAHVLGLVAGGEYQDPFADGADIVVASTNKTFPGPHRGIVLTNDEDLHRRICSILSPAPYFQSSHHPGSAVALVLALAEMLEFGRDFARQIVRNAQALAADLLQEAVPLIGSGTPRTFSHQVVLDFGLGSERAAYLCRRLEDAHVCADAGVRLATQQLTRLGMREPEMAEVAQIVASVVLAPEDDARVRRARERARELAGSFRRIHFSFESPPLR